MSGGSTGESEDGIGAGLTPAAQTIIRTTMTDLRSRALGRLEKVRVKNVGEIVSAEIRRRIEEGEQVRDDGFFSDTADSRPDAEELFEGVLLVAQRDHEERKLRHLAMLYANVTFDPVIDRSAANWFLTLAQQLTWTQYVLIELVYRKASLPLPDLTIGVAEEMSWPSWSVQSQLLDLGWGRRGILAGMRTQTPRMGLRQVDTTLQGQELGSDGVALRHLLSLDLVPESEIIRILDALKTPPPTAP